MHYEATVQRACGWSVRRSVCDYRCAYQLYHIKLELALVNATVVMVVLASGLAWWSHSASLDNGTSVEETATRDPLSSAVGLRPAGVREFENSPETIEG